MLKHTFLLIVSMLIIGTKCKKNCLSCLDYFKFETKDNINQHVIKTETSIEFNLLAFCHIVKYECEDNKSVLYLIFPFG